MGDGKRSVLGKFIKSLSLMIQMEVWNFYFYSLVEIKALFWQSDSITNNLVILLVWELYEKTAAVYRTILVM